MPRRHSSRPTDRRTRSSGGSSPCSYGGTGCSPCSYGRTGRSHAASYDGGPSVQACSPAPSNRRTGTQRPGKARGGERIFNRIAG